MKPQMFVSLSLSILWIMNHVDVSAQESSVECVTPPFMARADIPGLGLAEVSSDEIQVKVYGYSKVGEKCVTDDTMFEAASLTKPVVAYLVMRLVERDVLKLDDALIDLLPSLPLPKDDPRSKQVTVRMALAHMSGLEGPDDRMLKFAEDPGTQFRYYPAGYRLVQRIVEQLEKTELNALAQREVFVPLGMKSTSLVYKPEFAKRLATRHNILSEPIDRKRDPNLPANAAASLLTTTGDYARFLQEMLNPQELTKESVESMLMPQIEIEETSGAVAWGIGWGLEPERGTFFHWGDDGAAKCFTIGSRGKDQALVYFTNSFHGMCIAAEMSQRLFEGEAPSVKWLGYRNWDSPFRFARRDILRAFIEDGPDAGMSTFTDYERRFDDLDMPELARWMAWLLDLRSLHAERIKILNWQIDRKPTDVDLYLKLARSQQEVGDDSNAIETLRAVRSKANESMYAYIDRQISWIEGDLLAKKNKDKPSGLDHSTLIGVYQVRQITSEDDVLWYQRQGSPRVKLNWMHGTTFVFDDDDSLRLRFVIEDGSAEKIILFNSSGGSAESIRSDSNK